MQNENNLQYDKCNPLELKRELIIKVEDHDDVEAIIAENQVEESRPLERNINSTNDVDPLSININEPLFPITDKMRRRIKLMKFRMLLKIKLLKQRRPKVAEALTIAVIAVYTQAS